MTNKRDKISYSNTNQIIHTSPPKYFFKQSSCVLKTDEGEFFQSTEIIFDLSCGMKRILYTYNTIYLPIIYMLLI